MTGASERWIEASDVLSIFPTLVWQLQLTPAARDAIEPGALAAIKAARRGLPPLAAGQGWQSEQSLHRRDDFRRFVAGTLEVAGRVLAFLHIGYDEIEMTACWANMLAPGASHPIHTHPNNYLSGVYYVRTQPGADTINFHDPRVQTAVIRAPVSALGNENADQAVVRVRNGTLLMFPSWLEHSVDANRSTKLRISLSYNLMFSRFTENLSKPLW